MSLQRSFTVFQDTADTVSSTSSTVKAVPTVLSTLSTTTTSSTSSSLSSIIDSLSNNPLSPIEKENLHPVTGLPSLPLSASSKKRKSDVLATKLHNPTISSDIGKSIKKDAKSRKVGVTPSSTAMRRTKSANTVIKVKNSKDKDRRALGASSNSLYPSSRKGMSISRSYSVLGPVAEVPDTSDTSEVQLRMETTGALIDSRCYELTVSPLADVSTAYLQSSSSQDDEAGGDTDVEDGDASELRRSKPERFRMSRSVTTISRFGTFASYSPAKPSFSRSISLSALDRSLSGLNSVSSSMDHDPGFAVFRDAPSTSKSSNIETDQFSQQEVTEDPLVLTTPERKQLYAQFTFSSPLRSLKN